MGYSYKGSISFGLVYIPITLHNCVKNNDVSFNLLDKKTMSRVKYKKTCIDCGDREVSQEDIVKGFEYEDGKYVIFEEEDFEKIKSQKDKNITIQQFVNVDEIDPIYYDKPYYVSPAGADRAFGLLCKAMEEENKVGIAKTVLGTKETLIAIRAKNGQMLLNTLFFYEEIQNNPAKDTKMEIDKNELDLAKTIITNMAKPFEPEVFKDEYNEKIQKAILDKIAGKQIAAPKERADNQIANLMEALQASLNSFGKQTAKKETKLKKAQ